MAVYQSMVVSFNSNTKGVTSGAETAYPSRVHGFTPVFSEIRVARSLVFVVVFCISLLDLSLIYGF